MTRPGRLLRQKWADDARETPERVRERIRYREAHKQAFREMMARFDPLTLENFQAATDWQHERIKELVG